MVLSGLHLMQICVGQIKLHAAMLSLQFMFLREKAKKKKKGANAAQMETGFFSLIKTWQRLHCGEQRLQSGNLQWEASSFNASCKCEQNFFFFFFNISFLKPSPMVQQVRVI